MQILVRHLRWTEEVLDHEASDRHRHALLEGLGLSEESKTVNSAAVKLEESDKKRARTRWRERRGRSSGVLAATLKVHGLGQGGRAVRREEDIVESHVWALSEGSGPEQIANMAPKMTNLPGVVFQGIAIP